MMNTSYDGLPPVSAFIEKYGLRAKKSLGQNFLCDLNLADRIARSVPEIAGSAVLEIGSGPAGLTRALLKNGAAKVLAVEFDGRAIGVLAELREKYGGRLEALEADALSLDYAELKRKHAAGLDFRICANLPYNISVPLLAKWIFADVADSMTLMFQREVAARIAAPSRTKDYGRISIVAQLTHRTRVLFGVNRNSFTPAPKVSSSLVELARLSSRPEPGLLLKVAGLAKLAFSGRRKMLRGSLRPLFGDAAALEQTLSAAGIAPTMRAEEIPPEGFLRLASLLPPP
ncbi:MAG: 16S rRNA (adenine(1518)-N(6)/adenine(1519)-N(6))-dimethyltransferase RsmA [Rickettsiales bacterium]|nr:16S rRNA (adenine(1518)-N(6)/adenine(1519)-N(6))-dimethyltransferase RsmA [Rickettsiales bacterium]